MKDFEQELLGQLIGLARATDGNEHLITDAATELIAKILTTNVQNEVQFSTYSGKITVAKQEMVPDCFLCANPCGRTASFDLKQLEGEPEQVRQTKLSVLEDIKTLAASARNPVMDRKLYRGLVIIGLEGYSSEELTQLFAET